MPEAVAIFNTLSVKEKIAVLNWNLDLRAKTRLLEIAGGDSDINVALAGKARSLKYKSTLPLDDPTKERLKNEQVDGGLFADKQYLLDALVQFDDACLVPTFKGILEHIRDRKEGRDKESISFNEGSLLTWLVKHGEDPLHFYSEDQIRYAFGTTQICGSLKDDFIDAWGSKGLNLYRREVKEALKSEWGYDRTYVGYFARGLRKFGDENDLALLKEHIRH